MSRTFIEPQSSPIGCVNLCIHNDQNFVCPTFVFFSCFFASLSVYLSQGYAIIGPVAVLHSDWKSVKQVLLTLLCLNSKYKES